MLDSILPVTFSNNQICILYTKVYLYTRIFKNVCLLNKERFDEECRNTMLNNKFISMAYDQHKLYS